MTDPKNTQSNTAAIAAINDYIERIHDGILVRGFYGSVQVTWSIKDGVIQQDCRVDLSETKRLYNK